MKWGTENDSWWPALVGCNGWSSLKLACAHLRTATTLPIVACDGGDFYVRNRWLIWFAANARRWWVIAHTASLPKASIHRGGVAVVARSKPVQI